VLLDISRAFSINFLFSLHHISSAAGPCTHDVVLYSCSSCCSDVILGQLNVLHAGCNEQFAQQHNSHHTIPTAVETNSPTGIISSTIIVVSLLLRVHTLTEWTRSGLRSTKLRRLKSSTEWVIVAEPTIVNLSISTGMPDQCKSCSVHPHLKYLPWMKMISVIIVLYLTSHYNQMLQSI